MNDAPMIYTKNGNVLESTTRYEHEWIEGDQVLMFHERWYDIESGELVKNSSHGYVKRGLTIGGQQAVM